MSFMLNSQLRIKTHPPMATVKQQPVDEDEAAAVATSTSDVSDLLAAPVAHEQPPTTSTAEEPKQKKKRRVEEPQPSASINGVDGAGGSGGLKLKINLKDRKASEKKRAGRPLSPRKAAASSTSRAAEGEPSGSPKPLQVHVPTSVKAQKRKAIKTKLDPLSEEVLLAQQREQERLERLEQKRKHSQFNAAASYAPVPVRPSSAAAASPDEVEVLPPPPLLARPNADDAILDVDDESRPTVRLPDGDEEEIIFLEEIAAKKKKRSIEVVELSSDDSDGEITQAALARRRAQPAYIRDISPRKTALAVREEEKRHKRVHRKSNNLESMELTAEGRLLVNDGKPKEDPDVFVSPHLTHVLQPHQLGGIRFMYDNVIESIHDFDPNAGFGCILAHSMGLGKTIQIIAFTEIFLRVTRSKRVLIICPINVIQNWLAEFDKWLPIAELKRDFPVFLLGDACKTTKSRWELVSSWEQEGGVLLLGYEMYRLLTLRKGAKAEANDGIAEYHKAFCRALINPGSDLIVCDEGHRIKNLKTDVTAALSMIRTKRRIVLTGYPLQNNLLEYFCMVNFIRPDYLGDKKRFMQMFERPIRNGMCIDSTKADMRLAQERTHVLTQQLRGFVQRRTHHLLKKILPDSREYVCVIRKSAVQRDLYKEFVKFVTEELQGANRVYYNPLKAYAVCSKIWNHPDLLYRAWMHQLTILDYTDMFEEMNKQLGGPAPPKQPPQQPAAPQFDPYGFPTNVRQQTATSAFYPPETKPFQQQQQQQPYGGLNAWPPHNGNPFNQPLYPQQQQANGFNGGPPNGHFGGAMNGASTSAWPQQLPPAAAQQQPEAKPEEKKKGAKKKRKGLVQTIVDDEDGSIPYYWADKVLHEYQEGILEHSNKMRVALEIIEQTIKRDEKILLFSQSLLTLSLIEEFLKKRGEFVLPSGETFLWQTGQTYFRFDGSTSGSDREKLINRFNADPSVRLFLISTRAGSLGVNLVSACRAIIFDCNFNPMWDSQAVCRIYRYGQQKKTFIYRLITHNCMERAIFARQISKHGLQQRVVDENFVDAKVTQRELENLIAYDEVAEMDTGRPDTSGWAIEDDLLDGIAQATPEHFAECPFLHESLMLEQEETLSAEEKQQAELLYEHEKKRMLFGDHPPAAHNGLSFQTTYNAAARMPGPSFGYLPPLAANSALYQQPGGQRAYQNQPGGFDSTPSFFPAGVPLRPFDGARMFGGNFAQPAHQPPPQFPNSSTAWFNDF